MFRQISCIALAIVIAAPLCPATAQAEKNQVEIALGKEGLSSLKLGGTEFLADGEFQVTGVNLQTWDGAVSAADLKNPKVSAGNSQVVKQYEWGMVRCVYTAAGSHLILEISLTNTSDQVISGIFLQPLVLKLPEKPQEYDGTTPILAHDVGSPSVLALHYGSGAVAVCNEDVGRPLMIGFPWALDRPASKTFPLWVFTSRHSSLPDSLPLINRPIYPGGTDHYTLSLRFGPGGEAPGELAGDIYREFAAAYPFKLQWADRRPIGELFISTASAGWARNPRGWLQDPTIDVTTPAGVTEFKQKLMKYADNSVTVLKGMNAQGMITWDPEGQEFPHATSYLGDPRSLPPEIEDVIDAYFKKFTDAGFRVGICVRPQRPVRAAYGGGVWQQEVADPAQNLIDKISYARKRWGCTLFYVDSNGDPSLPMDASIFRKVALAHPDVLLMPEHKNTLYHAYTAPYNELRQGFAGTRPDVRAVYPNAFDVIIVTDGPIEKRWNELVTAVKQGDILLFRGWFPDSYNAQVKKIYQEAGK